MVIVADLGFYRAACALRFGCLLQDAPQKAFIVLFELRVDVPARLIRRNGVLLNPGSTGIAEEIGARVRGAIHRGDIQAWTIRQGKQRRFLVGRLPQKKGRAAEERQRRKETSHTVMVDQLATTIAPGS